MNIKIAPSMLSADFANLEHDLKEVEKSGADFLHVDIMDGHFVPNITMGPDQVAQIRKTTTIPFDIHLMISEPLKYINQFADAGADIITVHVESEGDIQACIDAIVKKGVKPGLVLSPDTPLKVLEPYLDQIKMVLIMCVYPGFGGQSYLSGCTQKIRECRKMLGSRSIDLEIDGGINFNTLKEVVDAGANVIVSGSCLFKGQIQENMKRFRKIIEG
ncbi:ribulose-phosphate 3-epimerase [Acetobacterium tundrae]|uniref:Ribulose-phosphate 3-epimerase n=1 Tax=Acetobacterium tundrae TaxID=132932 RepID=A0ABR6WNB0_9FIRM|nr:ribulose-phosphate 3-epimerase [Acetobacterium tundrae]MBC3797773.1 ribulose-phosphate 3-epimerase [Acetobacterium tundrae]